MKLKYYESFSSFHIDDSGCWNFLTETAEEDVEDADGEEDEDNVEDEDAEEEGSSSESEWEEVVDGEEVDTGEADEAAEEKKTGKDSDSERLSSEADAGTCEEYDEFFSPLFLFCLFVRTCELSY